MYSVLQLITKVVSTSSKVKVPPSKKDRMELRGAKGAAVRDGPYPTELYLPSTRAQQTAPALQVAKHVPKNNSKDRARNAAVHCLSMGEIALRWGLRSCSSVVVVPGQPTSTGNGM